MDKLRNVTHEDVSALIAIFIGSTLATIGAGYFLVWSTSLLGKSFWLPILLSLAAAIIYSVIIGGIVYLFLPNSESHLEKVSVRQK
jgi:roadblock/LC7 domain-containing protein